MKTMLTDQQTESSFQVTFFHIELKKKQVHRNTTNFS